MTRNNKRRDLILDQANRLFAEKGFSATSLEDIAEAAGIRRESLYYYYPGKYDLLYDIIEPQIVNTIRNFDAIVCDEADFRTAIRQAIENHLQQFNASYLHMAMMIRKTSKDEVQQKFIHLRDLFKQYEKGWIRLVTKGCEATAIRTDISPQMLAYSILGLCNSLSSWYRPEGTLSLADIGQQYADIILEGIGA